VYVYVDLVIIYSPAVSMFVKSIV